MCVPVGVSRARALVLTIAMAATLSVFGGCENSIASDEPDVTPIQVNQCSSNDHCKDSNPCTAGTCTDGKCHHTLTPGVSCSFGKCSTGTCSDEGVCKTSIEVGKACDDEDPCTGDGSCDAAGSCAAGQPSVGKACDDGSACTVGDACDAQAACAGTPAAAGTACNDLDLCTEGDSCDAAGKCTPGTAVPLDNDACKSCSCSPEYGVECAVVTTAACACSIVGKIKYVDNFEDFTIEVVESGSVDLEVELKSSGADSPGEWQEVTSFEDYKVKIVESFGDIRVRFVDSATGCP